jgi:hypothetical protein
MKYYQLCYNDIIVFNNDTEVLFDSCRSNDALNDLSISYEEGVSLLKAMVPIGTKLKVIDHTDDDERISCLITFEIIEWLPFLISNRYIVEIPSDIISNLDITIESKHDEILFNKKAEVNTKYDSDEEDFSHIS